MKILPPLAVSARRSVALRILRRSRLGLALQHLAMLGLILQPMPATSYWTDSDNDGVPEEVANPPEGDSWWSEDSDSDGMTNAEEVLFLSDPYRLDSDFDGLTDRDERDLTPPVLFGGLAHTDPWDWDSNDNGYSDHDEYFYALQGRAPNVSYAGLTQFYSYYDADGDGIHNQDDADPVTMDRDGDGLVNWQDSYMDDYYNGSPPPVDPWYYADDDNDGTINGNDPYPSDWWNAQPHYYWDGAERAGTWSDQDGDGTPDDFDPTPVPGYTYNGTFYAGAWSDRDGDSVPDPADPTPDGTYWYHDQEYPGPWADSDSDGIPNPADSIDSSNSHWYNGTEYSGPFADSDGDSIPNSADSWPNDPENGLDSDGDGLDNYTELNNTHTDPNDVDSDDDYLTDGEEALVTHTHPKDPTTGENQTVLDFFAFSGPDSDNDGLPDLVEQHYADDPSASDATTWLSATGDLDGDGVSNLQAYWFGWDLTAYLNQYDLDGDSITDAQEDYWNVLYPGTMDKAVFADAVADPDGDGLTNLEELGAGTDPNNPRSLHPEVVDGQLRAWWDYTATPYQWGYDWNLMINPWDEPAYLPCPEQYLHGDMDGDGLPDGYQNYVATYGAPPVPGAVPADADGDGMSNVWEHRHQLRMRDGRDAQTPVITTLPAQPQVNDHIDWERYNNDYPDGGGDPLHYVNGSEYQAACHNYTLAMHEIATRPGCDPDHDTLTNLQEHTLQSHPRIADSDGDGFADGYELELGIDPLLKNHPANEVTAVWNLAGTQLLMSLFGGQVTSPLTAAHISQIQAALAAMSAPGFLSLLQVHLAASPNSASASGLSGLLASLHASGGVVPQPVGGASLPQADLLKKDEDGDGWDALREFNEGTSDRKADTDGDGVADPKDGVAYDRHFRHERVTEQFAVIEVPGGTTDWPAGTIMGPEGYSAWYQPHADGARWVTGGIGVPVPHVLDLGDLEWGGPRHMSSDGKVMVRGSLPDGTPVLRTQALNGQIVQSLPLNFDVPDDGVGGTSDGDLTLDGWEVMAYTENGGIYLDALLGRHIPSSTGLEEPVWIGYSGTFGPASINGTWNTRQWYLSAFRMAPHSTTTEWGTLFDTFVSRASNRHVVEHVRRWEHDSVLGLYYIAEVYELKNGAVYSSQNYLDPNSAPLNTITALGDRSILFGDSQGRMANQLGYPGQLYDGPLTRKTLGSISHVSEKGMALANSPDGSYVHLWVNGHSKPLPDWLTEQQRLDHPGLHPIGLNDRGLLLAYKPSSDGRYQLCYLLPMEIVAHKRGTLNAPGAQVPRGTGEFGYETVMMENGDSESAANSTGRDCEQTGNLNDYRKANDDDVVKVVLKFPANTKISGASLKLIHEGMQVDATKTTPEAAVSTSGASRLKFYKADGKLIADPDTDLQIPDLANPPADRYLSKIVTDGEVTIFIEGANEFGDLPISKMARLGGALLKLEFQKGETKATEKLLVYRGGFLRYVQPAGAPGTVGTLEFRDGKGRVKHEWGGKGNEFQKDETDMGTILASWAAKSGKTTNNPAKQLQGKDYDVSEGYGHTPPGWWRQASAGGLTGKQRDQATGSGDTKKN